MAQPGMKWYVLRAVSGKEAKVKEYLEALMKKGSRRNYSSLAMY